MNNQTSHQDFMIYVHLVSAIYPKSERLCFFFFLAYVFLL